MISAKAFIVFNTPKYSGSVSILATLSNHGEILNPKICYSYLVYMEGIFSQRPLPMTGPFPADKRELENHITDLADDAWVTTDE